MTLYIDTLAQKMASYLLQIKAVSLSPNSPFTWASGIKSPIYCDNRKVLSFVAARNFLADSLSEIIKSKFPTANVIAGTATAGIAPGVLAADRLKLPFVYVRSQAKDHGKGQQIEGELPTDAQVVVIDDLISTGGSVLKAAQALQDQATTVLGVAALFSYELPQGMHAFTSANLPIYTVSNYPTLLQTALQDGYITPSDISTLEKWREDTKAWSDSHS